MQNSKRVNEASKVVLEKMRKMSPEELLSHVSEHGKDENLSALLKGTSSLRNNGCDEDGWDLYEDQTRKEFEYYAARRGYSVLRNAAYEWVYAETRTEDAWEMYHHGHVKGRTWDEPN